MTKTLSRDETISVLKATNAGFQRLYHSTSERFHFLQSRIDDVHRYHQSLQQQMEKAVNARNRILARSQFATMIKLKDYCRNSLQDMLNHALDSDPHLPTASRISDRLQELTDKLSKFEVSKSYVIF